MRRPHFERSSTVALIAGVIIWAVAVAAPGFLPRGVAIIFLALFTFLLGVRIGEEG